MSTETKDQEIEREISQIVRNIQDEASRTQYHREHDGWGYEKARAEDNANEIYYTDKIEALITKREILARIEVLRSLEAGLKKGLDTNHE